MSAKKKGPKIAISGYYGFDNCGDEAVLLAIIHCLKKLRPDVRIVVFSNNPSMTHEIYGVDAVNRWNPVKVALKILTSSLLISGGGSLIQDVTSSKNAFYYLGVILMALILKKKVMIYSQGIGPLSIEKNRIRTQKILSRCNVIAVRDNRSADFLKELGIDQDIHVVCDPVMALCHEDIDIDEIRGLLHESSVLESMDETRKPLLFVAVRNWKDDEHIAPVANLLDTQILAGWDVLLVPAHFKEDMEAISKLVSIMSKKPYCIDKCLTARQFMALTARADKVFSMRLHGLICAMAMGTPMMGLSYDPKVDGFMEQSGQGRYCIPYVGIDLITSRALLQELDDLPSDSKQKLEYRRQEMQTTAWETAAKAVELLQK